MLAALPHAAIRTRRSASSSPKTFFSSHFTPSLLLEPPASRCDLRLLTVRPGVVGGLAIPHQAQSDGKPLRRAAKTLDNQENNAYRPLRSTTPLKPLQLGNRPPSSSFYSRWYSATQQDWFWRRSRPRYLSTIAIHPPSARAQVAARIYFTDSNRIASPPASRHRSSNRFVERVKQLDSDPASNPQ